MLNVVIADLFVIPFIYLKQERRKNKKKYFTRKELIIAILLNQWPQ